MGLLKMKFNAGDRSLQLTVNGNTTVLFLEPVSTLKLRLESKPLRVCTFCNAAEFVQYAIRDLGWPIEDWEAHDIDPVARSIAQASFPGIRHPDPQDVLKLPVSYLADKSELVDLVLITTECVTFSKAKVAPPPLGFDDPRADPLVHMSKMIRQGIAAGKIAFFISEQVPVHPALKGAAAEQDQLIGIEDHGHGYVPDDAADSGSASRRVRRFAQNITNLRKLPIRPPTHANVLVNEGCTTQQHPLPCLVAADHTHSPAQVYDPQLRDVRPLCEEEREAVMGYQRGVTNAFGAVDVKPKKRRQLMGAALNYWQMSAILRELPTLAHVISHVAAPIMLGADPNNLEAMFRNKSLEETKQWITARFADIGFEMPQLHITLKDESMLPYQSKQRVTVQAGLVASAEDWVRDALKAGIIKKAEYSHEMWISAQFFKEKPGRTNAYGHPEVRPLVDQKILTDACQHPMFWLESMPTVASAGSAIPSASKRFVELDIEGFYNLLGVHFTSHKYQGVWILGELYVYLVCIQGSGPAAAWANFVLEYLYNAAFGMAWTNWVTKFVDDHLCYGIDDAQALNRAKIMRAVLEVGGLKVSDKTPGVSKDSGQLAGITVTSQGITLNTEAVDALRIALGATPKTVTELKSMIGVILYAHTAFEWDVQDLAWFAKTMSPLHKAATLKPILWGSECTQAVDALLGRIQTSPRWFTHFEDLVTEDTCLIIMSDASDTGGGVALFLVKLPCATMVVPTIHLVDPKVSRLLSTRSKVFSEVDCRRPTFEQEFKMAVFGIKTWGNMITTLTIAYPPGAGNPSKIGCFTDSSVTASKLGGGQDGQQRSFVYELPTEPINFISARAKSFLEMRDSIAYSRYWPMVVRFTKGETNSLADLLSRVADLLKELADKHKEAGTSFTAAPVVLHIDPHLVGCNHAVSPLRLHSYHGSDAEGGPDERDREAAPMPLKGLALDRTDTEAMKRAYEADDSLYHKVKMSEIYRACTEGSESLHPSIAAKVKPWINKRFYVEDSILYTQASYVKFRDTAVGQDPSLDQTIEDRATLAAFMVPVIPPDAAVKISESDAPATTIPNLREDILLIVHDFRMHAPLGEMQQQVRLIGWWPTVLTDCRYHVKTCAICLQHRHCITPAGLSTQAMERLAVMQFDHCVLEPAVAEATGYWAILTMVDVGSGQIVLAPAEDKSARRTAYLIFTHWIRTYGIPKVIQSDSDAGYRSDVMKLVCRYLGIKAHDTSARAQKGTAAKAERANAYVRRMERVMTANGQVSASHLHMYLAAIEIAANQQNEWSGHSSHERLFAQKPITVSDLIAPGDFPVINIEDQHLAADDAAWITFFAERARDMHLRRLESADERARNTTLARDTAIGASNATVFDLRTGDKVSYSGESYTLLTLNGPPGEPITAIISQEGKRDRKVRYEALRPLATARPLIRLPFLTPCDTGAFLIYEAGDDMVAFGKVLKQDAQGITVHLHESNQQNSRWHAMHLLADGEVKAFTHKKEPPAGSRPHIDQIQSEAVLAVGEISAAGALSAELSEARRAIGIT
jgi:site-specific DNA-cytosine methylase